MFWDTAIMSLSSMESHCPRYLKVLTCLSVVLLAVRVGGVAWATIICCIRCCLVSCLQPLLHSLLADVCHAVLHIESHTPSIVVVCLLQ